MKTLRRAAESAPEANICHPLCRTGAPPPHRHSGIYWLLCQLICLCCSVVLRCDGVARFAGVSIHHGVRLKLFTFLTSASQLLRFCPAPHSCVVAVDVSPPVLSGKEICGTGARSRVSGLSRSVWRDADEEVEFGSAAQRCQIANGVFSSFYPLASSFLPQNHIFNSFQSAHLFLCTL